MRTSSRLCAVLVVAVAAAGCGKKQETDKAPAAGSAAAGSAAAGSAAAGSAATAPAEPLTMPPPPAQVGTLECKQSCTVTGSLDDAMIDALRTQLGTRQLELAGATNDDLVRITRLADLVTDLDVRESDAITDLSPLARLTKVEKLWLMKLPNATDLAPIGALTHLTKLTLHQQGFTSSAFFAGLRDLQEVSIYMPPDVVTEVAGLAGLPALTKLELYAAKQVSDLAPLAELPALRELSLYGSTGITDLGPVGKLTGLTQLSLYGVKAKDLSPIASLTNLEKIWLYATAFDDYTPLAKLTKLKSLRAGMSRFDRLDVIASMPALEELELWRDPVTDFVALVGADSLTSLTLRDVAFDDLSILAKLDHLRRLDIGGCKVGEAMAISTLPELAELRLDGAEGIEDLADFAALPKLRSIHVKKGQFPDAQIKALKAERPQVRIDGA
ncbi:MAG: hypothetical protein H6708_29745 [Kofleriaceae bacterium]|nr:hypothetical protein [Kofleriaceae bacterium]